MDMFSKHIGVSEDNKALVLYEDGDILYVCKALIGSPLASAVWQIKKIDTTTGVVIVRYRGVGELRYLERRAVFLYD